MLSKSATSFSCSFKLDKKELRIIKEKQSASMESFAEPGNVKETYEGTFEWNLVLGP